MHTHEPIHICAYDYFYFRLLFSVDRASWEGSAFRARLMNASGGRAHYLFGHRWVIFFSVSRLYFGFVVRLGVKWFF